MRLSECIRNREFYHCYQPIFTVSTGDIWAYEALLRTHAGMPPDELFSLSRRHDLLYELDTSSLEQAVKHYASRGLKPLLFVNLFPSTILHSDFRSFIDHLGEFFDLRRIVLEINEAPSDIELRSYDELGKELSDLKERGFQIALDDISEGSNGLKLIVHMNPDYIKLDKYFARQNDRQLKKKKLIRMLTEFCHPETKVVLEGIETPEALHMARSVNIDFAQGYLLGKPEML